MEREITTQVDMCLPNGRLNPEAVGWSRTPLHRANLRGWGRNKRFEYWCISTPTHVVALNISDTDYKVTSAGFFLDKTTLHAIPLAEIQWFKNGTKSLTGTANQPIVGVGKDIKIRMTPYEGGVKLQMDSDRLKVDLDVTVAPDHQSMGVLVPWSEKVFQYTRKDNCLPVSGKTIADGIEYPVSAEDSFATLDHGRGRWPYSIVWNWASGSGRTDGREIGLQFGGKWTEGTPSTENSLRIDGEIQKISEELTWTYDRSDWMKPWRIHGSRVELTFTPIYDRYSNFNKLIVLSREHQCFGYFDGEITSESGEKIRVSSVFGWAEEVKRRW